MKLFIPNISWHNRDPVYSVDIQQLVHSNEDGSQYYRIATCGSDNYVVIWRAHLNPDQKANVNKQSAIKESIDKDVSALMTSLLDRSVSALDGLGSPEKAGGQASAQRDTSANRRTADEPPKKDANKKLIELECVSTLKYHERAANVVRFAPSKNLLASGGDDNVVFIYEYQGEKYAFFLWK